MNMTEDRKRFFDVLFEGLKLIGLLAGGAWIVLSYKEDIDKPFFAKQLDLYLEATRVVARMAATPPAALDAETKTRFWELYWGELYLVESPSMEEGSNAIEARMVAFCLTYFKGSDELSRCKAGAASGAGNDSLAKAADLAAAAKAEIKGRWWSDWRWQSKDSNL